MRGQYRTRFGTDGKCVCNDKSDPLRELDMHLLRYSQKSGGWAAMSTLFLKNGKEWVDVTGAPEMWKTQVGRMLEFLGAYRKIMIDYLITTHATELAKQAEENNSYGTFRDNQPLTSLVTYEALGSTNPTSDYDVTLRGPGLQYILRRVIGDFQRLHGSSTDSTADRATMSFTFDSNFYTGPDVLVSEKESRFRGLNLFYPSRSDGTHNVAVPVPTDTQTLMLERASILKKLTHAEESRISDKYEVLIKLTEELDKLAYRGDGETPVRADELFPLLFAMKETSIEAYHGVSTVLVVVYGMQAGKLEELRKQLTVGNYANACLENLLDFTAHWNEYQQRAEEKHEAAQRIIFTKLSKYLLRMVTCIGEIRSKLAEQVPSNAPFFFMVGCLKKQIEELVKARASGGYKDDIDYAAYGIGTDGKVAKLGTGSGFVHELFKYLEALVPGGFEAPHVQSAFGKRRQWR
jgi:hypothetical protein